MGSSEFLRFVSDNVWGSADRQFVFRHIAEYLVQAWMCVVLANILEQCSLFLPLRWGAGSMALMLWLDW
jgi:hypothetical protein